MKKLIFSLCFIFLVLSFGFTQIKFIGTFIDKNNAPINNLNAVLATTINNKPVTSGSAITNGQATIVLLINLNSSFSGSIKLKITDQNKTLLKIIPVNIQAKNTQTASVQEMNFNFSYSPGKDSASVYYLSGTSAIVKGPKEAASIKIDVSGQSSSSQSGQTAAITVNPPAGLYKSAQAVTFTCSNASLLLFYTLDGTTPTRDKSVKYSAPITISQDTTVSIIATTDKKWEAVGSLQAVYKITGKVATPVITPAGVTFKTVPQTITITTATPDATIRYTTTSTPPTKTSGEIYAKPIVINDSILIRAIAYKDNWDDSDVKVAEIGIDLGPAAKPVITPNGGTFSGSVTVTFSCTTPNVFYAYIKNSNNPYTSGNSFIMKAPFTITISEPCTLSVGAAGSGYSNSEVATATFTSKIPNITFSSRGGTYTKPINVTLTCSTPGAKIFYTIDGTNPIPNTSPQFAKTPIAISKTATVKAIAVKQGWINSDIITETFTF